LFIANLHIKFENIKTELWGRSLLNTKSRLLQFYSPRFVTLLLISIDPDAPFPAPARNMLIVHFVRL
jgi:hypothetical protein